MRVEDLVGIGLEGGTLVEYKGNCGFSLEYGRANITAVKVEGEEFSIETDNDESFMTLSLSKEARAIGYTAEVRKRGDFYLIASPMGWCYAVAPLGVIIPPRPGWLEVSDKQFDDTIRRTVCGE